MPPVNTVIGLLAGLGQFFRLNGAGDGKITLNRRTSRNEKPLPKDLINLAGYKGIYSCECDFRQNLIVAK